MSTATMATMRVAAVTKGITVTDTAATNQVTATDTAAATTSTPPSVWTEKGS
jgi:hypothetical protein